VKLLHPCRYHALFSVMALAMAVLPIPSTAQGARPGVKEAYFRAVGEHFGVSEAEVGIIGEWNLVPDEVPVVLFLARRAGVSPDALIGLRRGGHPWREVAVRFGIEPQDFHLPLPLEAELGPLARAYREFRQRPVREWSLIALDDQEIMALVNIRVLSEQAGVPPQRVLAGFAEAGSFMACFPLLLRR
jgi:hypothetical protein